MKIGPFVAMLGLIGLGVWLVWSRPAPMGSITLEQGSRIEHVRIGDERGVIEILPGEPAQFRLHMRNGWNSEKFGQAAFIERFGNDLLVTLQSDNTNGFFRLLNITSWVSVVWVGIGFGGQICFFGRMFVQWVVSEKKKESVVPEIFWWLSLFGGVALFTYFVWRRDLIGVLGQSSGVVIYARNLRLIHKRRKRALREKQQSEPDS